MIPFEEIELGERYETSTRTIFDADIVNFAGVSGDFNRLHLDDEFASRSYLGRRVAHGLLVTSVMSGLRSRLDDYAIAGWLHASRKFSAPVFVGDTLQGLYEVIELRASKSRPELGIVRLRVQTSVLGRGVVQEGEDVLAIERRGVRPAP